MRFLLTTQIQSVLDLLLMHLIEVFQQNIAIPLFALVLAHIVTPAAYCAGQATGHVGLFADVGDGVEVCSYGEDYAAGSGETTEYVSV